jgi:hypothetical protein
MVEFDNPLADYESHFRETHERLAREYFEMLLQTSQVDKQQNLVLVSERWSFVFLELIHQKSIVVLETSA